MSGGQRARERDVVAFGEQLGPARRERRTAAASARLRRWPEHPHAEAVVRDLRQPRRRSPRRRRRRASCRQLGRAVGARAGAVQPSAPATRLHRLRHAARRRASAPPRIPPPRRRWRPARWPTTTPRRGAALHRDQVHADAVAHGRQQPRAACRPGRRGSLRRTITASARGAECAQRRRRRRPAAGANLVPGVAQDRLARPARSGRSARQHRAQPP